MTARWYRPLMAAAAVGMALAGAFSVRFVGGSGTASAGGQNEPYTIEVSDVAVNPPTCNINRGDSVVWKNIGTKVHRMIKPDAGVNSPPLYDSGDIQPGETSSPALFESGGKFQYYDQYDPNISGMVVTPGTANNGSVSCKPLPPTPTPTPTRTPTPIPTPTPAPIVPAGCKWVGCAVGVAVASDK